MRDFKEVHVSKDGGNWFFRVISPSHVEREEDSCCPLLPVSQEDDEEGLW